VGIFSIWLWFPLRMAGRWPPKLLQYANLRTVDILQLRYANIRCSLTISFYSCFLSLISTSTLYILLPPKPDEWVFVSLLYTMHNNAPCISTTKYLMTHHHHNSARACRSRLARASSLCLKCFPCDLLGLVGGGGSILAFLFFCSVLPDLLLDTFIQPALQVRAVSERE